MYTPDTDPPPPPTATESPEEQLKYTDIKISHVEHLSMISYLTKAMEDALIRRVGFLKYPLLLIDIPLLFAVLIVNTERLIYTNVVDYILAHIRFDTRIITKPLRNVMPFGKKEEYFPEEEEEEEEFEETTSGKLFQFLRQLVRFLWGLFILGIVLPIWPLIILYNIFIEVVVVGALYYTLIFYHFPEWWGPLLYFFIFCTVTFIIASISVPALLRTFTYLKYLFSLERKSWREINNEARSAFLQFYLRIQRNRETLLARIEPRYEKEHKVEGGIYYLFLKTVYAIKDKVWDMRKKRVTDLVRKADTGIRQLTSDLAVEKEEYEQSVATMQPGELLRTALALGITFIFSALLITKGTHGEGIIGPILLSFFEPNTASITWANYQNLGIGYYEFLAQRIGFIPGVLRLLASGADTILVYFFQAYYYLLPMYIHFIQLYYQFYFGKIFSTILY